METKPAAHRGHGALWPDRAGDPVPEPALGHAVVHRHAAPAVSELARVMGVRNDERAWPVGTDDEEAVARRRLRSGR
jgi:hypothetical protein